MDVCRSSPLMAGRSEHLCEAAFARLPRARVPQPPAEARRPCVLVDLTSALPAVRQEIVYATHQNFLGRPVYSSAAAYLHADAVPALKLAADWFREHGLGLQVYDAYRPWSVTKAFWEASAPEWRRGFLADPSRGSTHNRAVAVDVSLFNLSDGALVEMPCGFDEFSERAHVAYRGASRAAAYNRDLLAQGMRRHGFQVLAEEWWHFDFGEPARYEVLDASFVEVGSIVACS